MSVPLVLDDCEPANTLMTLMESKKFKQRVGKSKSKQSSQIQTHPSPSESSDLDENPPPPRCPHLVQAARSAIMDAPDINENRHRRLAPPHPHAPHTLVTLGSRTTAEALDPDETPRPRPHRAQSQLPHATESWNEDAHPAAVNDRGRMSNATTHRHHLDTAQHDEQRLRNVPLATRHQQGYHEGSYPNERYASLQAPVHAHQRHATDADLNIRSRASTGVHTRNIHYHEYDDRPVGDGHYLPREILADTLIPSRRSPGPAETGRSNNGRGYHQPLAHDRRDLLKSQPSHVNQAHRLTVSRQREHSVEPLPKKRKIHDTDDRTPRQVLPMPRQAGNQVAGSSHSRMPHSFEAGPSRHRQHQVVEDHLEPLGEDPNGYDLYNDSGYYT
jgi:hypothetical protein